MLYSVCRRLRSRTATGRGGAAVKLRWRRERCAQVLEAATRYA